MTTSILAQHLEKLPGFVSVVRLGSMTQAARQLAISQAALSQSIGVLEGALGVQLLHRSRQGVEPTPMGQRVYEYGKRLLGDVELLEVGLKNPLRPPRSRLRIGTHETLAIHLWPEVIADFQAMVQDIAIELTSGRVDVLQNHLQEGGLDLTLTVEPLGRNGITSKAVYQDSFAFYGPKPTQGGRRKLTGRRVLTELPLLTDCRAHLREDRSLIQALAEVGLHADYFQLNSFEAAARLAGKGLGIAVLPRKIGDRLAANTGIAPIAKIAPKQHFAHTICLAHRRDNLCALDAVMAPLKRALNIW